MSMRKNLLEFLFGDTVIRESSQNLGEQVLKLFEEAADEETDEMVATKEPLVTALKSLGITGTVDAKAQGAELICDCPEQYREYIGILFNPENMNVLASKGWVAACCGDQAMTFEPAELKIGFIEIATVETDDKDKAPDLEKVLKDAQKFASTEVEHDDDNPVEFDDKTSNSRDKGVGDPADGKAPEGTPKGAKKTSESRLNELGGHYCQKCGKPCPGKWNGKTLCCDYCGGPLQFPKSSSLRSREARCPTCKHPTPNQVAESLLEMTSTGAIPAQEGPPMGTMKPNWSERLKALRKRRGEKTDDDRQ